MGPLRQRSRGRQLPVRNQLDLFRRADHRRPPHVSSSGWCAPWPSSTACWATFMPKPFGNLTGNGAHVHMSLADVKTGKNLFLDDPAADLGLSQSGRWFMGGVLRHARALSAMVAPLVNSYKRLVRGAPRSGATWAPVYVTYGHPTARR